MRPDYFAPAPPPDDEPVEVVDERHEHPTPPYSTFYMHTLKTRRFRPFEILAWLSLAICVGMGLGGFWYRAFRPMSTELFQAFAVTTVVAAVAAIAFLKLEEANR